MLAALIRPIFNQDDRERARDRLSEAVAHLEGKLPKVATVLEDAEEDVLAFYSFPADHRRKIRSTDPLERVNREIVRRTDVVGIFLNDRALLRLAASLVIEHTMSGSSAGATCRPAQTKRRFCNSGRPEKPSHFRRSLTPRPGT